MASMNTYRCHVHELITHKLSGHITFIGDNEDNRLFDVVIDGEKCFC